MALESISLSLVEQSQMSWFTNLKLKPKLLGAFGLCALITLAVAALGQLGITELYEKIQSITGNNLESIKNTAAIKANIVGTNRDFYKTIVLTTANADQADIDAVFQSYRDNQAEVMVSFKAYRTTPLEADERVAGNDFERDWPAYIAALDTGFAALKNGDAGLAKKIANDKVTPAYKKVMGEITVIIDSNSRQADESTQGAANTNLHVTWILVIGCLVAVLCAIVLGMTVTAMITRPIYRAVEGAGRVANGDLTQGIEVRGTDETGQLLKSLSDMQNDLKNTVHQIADASNQLASAAEELTAVTEDSTRGLVTQNDEIQQAATAVNEMTAAVEEVARNAVSTSQISSQTAEDALKGQKQVQQAVSAINTVTVEINDSTQRVEALAGQIHAITKVLDVIRGIAEQTNLLALNAAIEAARAGEQGRGFAVVADEVRALAHRTQVSTGEIEAMIGQVRNGADEAVHAMGKSRTLVQSTQLLATEAGLALERISKGVSQINERNLVIASAAEEQAQVAREVDRNLVNIQDLSTQTAAGANQTSASSQELSQLAMSFNSLVGKFKL
jgi:methyl-accepting chemotaxis protein